MRKFVSILLLLMMLLPLGINTVSATPLDELTTLADYFPEGTLAYATIHADDGLLEELSDLLDLVNDNVDGELLPPDVSAQEYLDVALSNLSGSWLNPALVEEWGIGLVAVGVLPIDNLMSMDDDDIPLLMAAQITNRAALEEVIRNGTEDNVVETAGDEYTLFTDGTTSILVSDDLLLAGNNVDVEAQFAAEGTLTESDAFTSTMEALPTDDYNIIIYADLAAFNELSMEAFEMMMDSSGGMTTGLTSLMMGNNAADADQIAAGFTIIDERTLTLDLAVTLPADGMLFMPTMKSESAPVDLDFAAYIPAEAEFVIQNTDYGGQALAIFEQLDTITPQIQALIDGSLETFVPEDEEIPTDVYFALEDFIREAQLQGIVTPEDLVELARVFDLSTINIGGITESAITPLFAGLTGLNLRDDVLTWMTGDYAIWLSLYPVESELDFTFDMAFLTEASDTEAAAYIVERMTEAIDLYDIGHFVETIGEGDALSVTAPFRALVLAMLPGTEEIVFNTPELDLVIGSDEEVFVVSSRPGAEFAMTQEGDALADDPAYQYAVENLFLEDTVNVFWFNSHALADDALSVLPAMAATMGEDSVEGADVALIVLANVLESATITSTMDEDSAATRLTLTIPAEAYAPLPEAEVTEVTTMIQTSTHYDGVAQIYVEGDVPQLGNPSADVVVELYESFSCPHCATFNETYLDDLVGYAATEDILIRFIPVQIFPTDGIATTAAACASDQAMFWEYHDGLFEIQREMGAAEGFVESNLISLAETTGLDVDDFVSCLFQLDTSFADLGTSMQIEAGVSATPTVIINGDMVNQTDVIAEIDSRLGE